MGFKNKYLSDSIYNAYDKDHDNKIEENEFVNFVNAHDAIVKKLRSHNSDVMLNKVDNVNSFGLEADKKFTKNLEALKQRFKEVDHSNRPGN